MARRKAAKYRTFTFRCEYGRDDDLIASLEGCEENERSEVIRTRLRQGNNMPLPPRPQVVDVDTLYAALGQFRDDILENIPVVSIARANGATVGSLKDVNDKGKNIPDF